MLTKQTLLTVATTALLACPPTAPAVWAAAPDARPNIVIILADDMGYSDIGCYGGEIPTPNLDKLARNGLRFSQFYNTSRCCPTRASLLTGLYQHQTGLGMMTTEGAKDFDFGVDGYRGFLNKNCVTLAEVLKQAGYRTHMTGKWHLGSNTPDKRPLQRGFDNYYGCYQGAFSYFDPKGPRGLVDGGRSIPAPEGFYSTDAFAEKAVEFLKNDTAAHAPNEAVPQKPFFLYLAFNAPHWPLHAKPEDIQKFSGKYMQGWDKLRAERFARQKELGLFDEATTLSPRDKRARPWDEVPEAQKIRSDYRMAVYAAQIHAIDYNVGKLVDYLEKSGQLDNTLILFLSDNGACAEPYQEFGGGAQGDINNPEKSGAISYGIGWANLSSTPFRLYKNNATEGGIATPFIAHFPAKIRSQKGKITHAQGHILDIMPTLLEVSGAVYPETFDGHEIQPFEGRSLLPVLFEGKSLDDTWRFWEHSYNRAARHGKWKAVSRIGTDKWALYNLETDRTELRDVSEEFPDVAADLASRWDAWARRCKALPKGQRTKSSYD